MQPYQSLNTSSGTCADNPILYALLRMFSWGLWAFIGIDGLELLPRVSWRIDHIHKDDSSLYFNVAAVFVVTLPWRPAPSHTGG